MLKATAFILVELNVGVAHGICHVEVVSELWMLACHGVDALHCRQNATAFAVAAHLCVLFVHIAR